MKTILSLFAILLSFNLTIAQTTAIPDANFEQYLIDIGADTGTPDGVVLTANIDTLNSIWVNSMNIGDLTGIQDFTALTQLYCFDNQLTSLDLSQNTALTYLYCGGNQLTSIDITQNTALRNFNCSRNQLMGLDVTQNTVLEFIVCRSNQITSLDLSQNTSLNKLDCDSNQLTSLNVKNGTNVGISGNSFTVHNNPYLTCIEVDDPVWSAANWTNIDPAASFSTSCSCPTLSVNIDSVSNITCLDSGKVFVSASGGVSPLRYTWVSTSPTYDSILTTASSGLHVIQVIDSNNCNLTKGVLIDGQKANGAFELNTGLNNRGFHPGRLSTVNLSAMNDGCVVTSGQLSISYSGPITYINSAINPDNTTSNSLSWNFTNWDYNTTQFLSSIQFMVDTTANMGDSVCFDVVITPVAGDADTTNNFKRYCFVVGNSYDPNDKQVYPQGECPENYVLKTKPLTYTIRFQNTGNAAAIDVYLLDTLSNNLDVNTLRVISQSHTPLITDVTDNRIIKFRFDNINLADSFSNEPASHGFVTYEIYPKTGLADGTVIENSASIYFDFNPPIITNSTLNTLTSVLPTTCTVGVNEMKQFSNFLLYPNPTTGNITVDLGETKTDIKARLFNNLGQVIFVKQYTSARLISLNIDGPSGIYFLQIVSEGVLVTKKILKE